MSISDIQEVRCDGASHHVAPLACIDRLAHELLQERGNRLAGLTEFQFQMRPHGHGLH
jgi:hypothetical protein